MSDQPRTVNWTITGGEVIGSSGVERRDVHIVDGQFADAPGSAARRFDATGLTVAPGMVDLHGDGFERNLSPRSGVFFDPETALIETDRQLIANGITTAYLAMTISWEPGLRSLDNARRLVAALDRVRSHLIADIRLQLRWEVFALDAVAEIEDWLTLTPRPTLAFNDHFSPLVADEGRLNPHLPVYAKRAGLTAEEYDELTSRTKSRAAEVPGVVARLARAAEKAGAVCFAHDETDAESRRRNRALGVAVSEFPLRRDAAAEAVAHDEPTILGAPNVVRGGSHIGAMDAAPAIAEGLCSALASDYYYPSMLAAAARLMADVGAPAEVWSLVSGNAASAVGLGDRGTMQPGASADLVLFARDGGAARVEAVFRRGAPVLVRNPARSFQDAAPLIAEHSDQ